MRCLFDMKYFLTISQTLPSGRADVQMDLWYCYYVFWTLRIVLYYREKQILPQQLLSISWNLSGILSAINQQKCDSKTEELGLLILPVNEVLSCLSKITTQSKCTHSKKQEDNSLLL